MSQYLIDRISSATNIEVRCRTEVVGCRGDGHLEALTLADRESGRAEEVPASWLFIFIGASPRTDWLGRDRRPRRQGVRHHRAGSGRRVGALAAADDRRTRWRPACPGVFAAGDVRLDSMKRVASAVGEGAMSIYLVHRYLATI